ncbi:MAG: hypothetical protein RBR52_13740 [Thiomonas sp.]|uniref:hypothetical protein n=1 Tax=Thiomonas sp. TaxID=2047785 RepID=UPI002A36BCE2|nr:hypothetical protein [Thiomonas sp.]MDY0331538.1 hypothetical protein [Thiomonas sp.]
MFLKNKTGGAGNAAKTAGGLRCFSGICYAPASPGQIGAKASIGASAQAVGFAARSARGSGPRPLLSLKSAGDQHLLPLPARQRRVAVSGQVLQAELAQ